MIRGQARMAVMDDVPINTQHTHKCYFCTYYDIFLLYIANRKKLLMQSKVLKSSGGRHIRSREFIIIKLNICF